MKLSAGEHAALTALVAAGGSMLETQIPEVNGRDVFGGVVAGIAVYLKLEKRGFLYFTDEDPIEAPGCPGGEFTFTPEVYITEAGRSALVQC